MSLPHYIMAHVQRVARDAKDGADVYFFGVAPVNEPSAEKLTELIRAHRGHYCEVDPFDGEEHSFIQLGAWLGDQGLALMLIGLGSLLGLWSLLTPKTVLGADVPIDLEKTMAEMGMISMQAKPGASASTGG